jgi:hypothetical protein
MARVTINHQKMHELGQLLSTMEVPPEMEASTHSFGWPGTPDDLGNCYLSIVAICHQTTPIGEPRLEGFIRGERKQGWDYLKEKYLLAAIEDSKWSQPSFMAVLTPDVLAELYEDSVLGRTLTRVSERCSLLNDIGSEFERIGLAGLRDAFEACGGKLAGDTGFLRFVSTLRAYSDPVQKKSMFLASLLKTECGFQFADASNLKSPVDYHELRGHLRIGTIDIHDPLMQRRISLGLPISEDEDTELRSAVQDVVDTLGLETGFGSSVLHYLFWNVFRNCCVRDASRTHCFDCGQSCTLPDQYRQAARFLERCAFSSVCRSAGCEAKVREPAYLGHYY